MTRAASVKWQGSLDGLCGIYSIINAVTYLGSGQLSAEAPTNLFRLLARELDADGKLPDVLTDGMKFRTLGRLIDVTADYIAGSNGLALSRDVRFNKGSGGLDVFWRSLGEHVAEYGPGSIILGLGGQYDHWTCVKSITDKAIQLIDSDGLHRINRSRATVGDQRGTRHHVLWDTQTYFLSLA